MKKYIIAAILALSPFLADATPPIYGPLMVQNNLNEITTNGTQSTAQVNLFGYTISLSGNFATSGANALTFITTGTTNVTLPTSGTLLTTAGAASTYAPIASPTFTGTVTIPTISVSAGTIDGTTIGATTPSTGAFNSLTSTHGVTFGTTGSSGGTVQLTNENLFTATNTSSIIQAVTGTSNAYVNLKNTDGATPTAFLVSGSGDTGGLDIQANSGFIDLASNTVFGGTFVFATHLLFSTTAPTIASGFGTSPSVSQQNGTAAFEITIGSSPGSTGTVTLPSANAGWACDSTDITTTSSSVFLTKETATTTTSVTFTQYNNAAVATPWVAGDQLVIKCTGF